MSRKSLFVVRLPEDRCTHEERAVALVKEELERTREKPRPRSAYEGYAYFLEEVTELWDEVRVRDVHSDRICKEAVQVAVTAIMLATWCLSQHLTGDHEQQAFGLLDSSLATAPKCYSAHEGYGHLLVAQQKLWRAMSRKRTRKTGLWAVRTAAAAVRIIELALSQEP